MKQSSLTAKLLKAKQAAHTRSPEAGQAQHAVPGRGWARVWKWALALLFISLTAGVTYAVFHFIILSKIPPEVVGTWRVEGGEMHGTRMTFHRNGTFKSLVRLDDGRDVLVEARVELRDKTLRFVYANPATGRNDTRTQTIKSLTPTEMIVQEGGGTSKLVRVE